MRPLNLRLRGFKGIKKGMGLDEIALDLSNIKGLVALAGENGRGKSSFLENLSPYRQLFSRNGNLNQHVYLRDSEKDFTFEHEGHIYRTLAKIDAESDRGEGFIWKDGEPQVNGKRKEYDKYIEDLLGSQFLFANSVFCAQNSKKLTDMRTGELREMFAEFLRLDRLTGYEATAKQIINVVSGKISQLDNRIEALKDRMLKRAILTGEELAVRQAIESATASRDARAQFLATITKSAERLKEKIQQNALHLQRRADIETNIVNLQGEQNELKFQEEKELADLRKRYGDLKAEIDKCGTLLMDREKIETAAGKAVELKAAIEKIEKDMETKAGDLAEWKESLAALEIGKKDIEQQTSALLRDEETQRLTNDLKDHQHNIDRATSELSRLQSSAELADIEGKIRQAKDKTKDLDLKDPACQSTACSFIVGALEAAKLLPELERERQGIVIDLDSKRYAVQKAIRELQVSIEKTKAALADRHCTVAKDLQAAGELQRRNAIEISRAKETIRNIEEAITEIRKCLATKRLEVKRHEDLAARLPEIKATAIRHDDLSKQMSDVMDKATVARLSWTKKQQEKQAQIDEKKAGLAEILSMIDATAEQSLKQIQADIAAKEQELASAGLLIDKKKGELAGIHAELKSIEAVEAEVLTAEAEKARLAGETSEWIYLRNACSKTGLQALEIDGVCPRIQYDANTLLAGTFGPNYSIRIVTQDEDGKEVFRVAVIREDGDETTLENLSGGQRVWILKALRLSLTLLSKQKSGRNFKASFADEEDGALDPENAQTFVSLYRSFMQAGGFDIFMFISHKAECLGFADHVLTFRKGGIDIN